MKVVVTGASGLIGSALVPALQADGHSVVTLVRRPPRSEIELRWDPAAGKLDEEALAGLAGVEAAVNLAGAGIGTRRWTEAYKRTIRESRIQTTTLLAETLARLDPQPRVLLSASGTGYYGDTGDEIADESAPGGRGFLAELAKDWEASTGIAEAAGIRVCHLRSGIVLSGRGGVLGRQLPLFRLGLGGRLGSGHQWTSWISLDDEVGAIRFLLGTEDVAGPVNLVAPQPVTNAAFTATLAATLRRPALLPVPTFALKAALGDLAPEILVSQRLLPGVLTMAGYQFRHPNLSSTLTAVVAKEL
jgi:uncharacterized protein (TIGR01777 family)